MPLKTPPKASWTPWYFQRRPGSFPRRCGCGSDCIHDPPLSTFSGWAQYESRMRIDGGTRSVASVVMTASREVRPLPRSDFVLELVHPQILQMDTD